MHQCWDHGNSHSLFCYIKIRLLQHSFIYGLPKYQINKLQNVQNAAARIIARLRKYDHISQTLKDLHWLPVEQRIVFKINMISHKVLNSTAPHYLQELLNRYEPLRRLRSSSDKWRFAMRRYSQETYGRRAFAIMAPKLWNKLPLELRSISKSNIFKSNLKTYILNKLMTYSFIPIILCYLSFLINNIDIFWY